MSNDDAVKKSKPDAAGDTTKCGDRCTWMHRTGIIMSDGEVITCGKHYGERVGIMNEQVTFGDLWNGSRMQSLRKSFGTPEMWRQCRECWLRELRWHAQRCARNEGRPYLDDDPANYSHSAWDYRDYDPL